MMYTGFDQAGDSLFNEEAPSVGHLLVMHDPSEEGGLDRTFRQVVRDNDGYIEDEHGVVVYDADEDEEFEP